THEGYSMNKNKNRLWLHTQLMKLVYTFGIDAAARSGITGIDQDGSLIFDPDHEGGPPETLDMYYLLTPSLLHATVFDCRRLPTAFVLDTADAIGEEPREIRGPVRLPFPSCYFEFVDEIEGVTGVLTITTQYVCDENDNEIPCFAYPVGYAVFRNSGPAWISLGEFANAPDHPLFEISAHNVSHEQHASALYGGKLVLGTLGLLRDRLVDQEHVPDSCPHGSRERRKKGKYPISGDSHVLTINVHAARR